jgi:hypothetical protein
MVVENEVQNFYSVVRLLPDQIRQEFANVGVIVVSADVVVVRTMREPSPVVRAISPPTAKELLERLPGLVMSRLGLALAPASDAPSLGTLGAARGQASSTFVGFIPESNRSRRDELLARLRESSLSGIWFTEQEIVLSNPVEETPVDVANDLYDEFVRPKRWPWSPATGVGRLQAQVKRYVKETVTKNALSVAAGLEVRSKWGTYDFPVAFANGTLTLVQAVDLDVAPKQQQTNTRAAIAVQVETYALLETMSSNVEWLNVVKEGPDSAAFFERLRHFSPRMLLDTQVRELASQIEVEGGTPVEDFFRDHGFAAERQESRVEVFAGVRPTAMRRH